VTIVCPLASFGSTPVILSTVPAGNRISASEGMAESLPMSTPRLVWIYTSKLVVLALTNEALVLQRSVAGSPGRLCGPRQSPGTYRWQAQRCWQLCSRMPTRSAAVASAYTRRAANTQSSTIAPPDRAKLYRVCDERGSVPTRRWRSCLGRRSLDPS
jgi:hypothetical protein